MHPNKQPDFSKYPKLTHPTLQIQILQRFGKFWIRRVSKLNFWKSKSDKHCVESDSTQKVQ